MNKRGQVWIETVIYTLIALVLIGGVIAFIAPKIGEIRDKAIIEQSITVMQNIENAMLSVVEGGPGNKRVIDLGIKKGSLRVNGTHDNIAFEIKSDLDYSQIDSEIDIGGILVLTEKEQSTNKITLTSNYSNYNITYDGEETTKTISQASTPYKFSIENKGNTKTVVDIVIS
jgi:type II secretory pathway pseudopilin PulG